MAKTYKPTGTACCPACAFEGHDGDSCRATQCEGGFILCTNCGRLTMTLPHEFYALPAPFKAAIIKLTSSSTPGLEPCKLTVVSTNNGIRLVGDTQSEEFERQSARATAAVAQDVDASCLDITRVVLKSQDEADITITLQGDPDDIKAAASATVPSKPVLLNYKLHQPRVPEYVRKVVADLLADGFEQTGCDVDSAMRHVLLSKGDVIPGTSARRGIRAQVSWIA